MPHTLHTCETAYIPGFTMFTVLGLRTHVNHRAQVILIIKLWEFHCDIVHKDAKGDLFQYPSVPFKGELLWPSVVL